VLTLLLTLGVVYLLREPLMTEAARLFIVDEALQPADAILVLGDDNYTGDRARRAAELYNGRWAPKVVVSGRYLRPYANVAELMKRDAMQSGVAEGAVIPVAHFAANTRQEAFALRKLIREQRWRRVIVVTSNYHTRRTRYIFRRAMDKDVEVRVAAAADRDFNPAAWWQARAGTRIFFRELFAWPVAVWEMWDSQEPPAGAPAPSEAVP
jgi:uncharacterized SAM-binding protein YcdF (DUF218 family)